MMNFIRSRPEHHNVWGGGGKKKRTQCLLVAGLDHKATLIPKGAQLKLSGVVVVRAWHQAAPIPTK